MRIDAQQNRDRVLAAARAEFTAHGPAASLNKIAQRAGVGPGTLYRHFPVLADLLVAVIAEDVAALCARGESLLDHPDPGQALRVWLRAVARHSSAMRGLVAAELLGAVQNSALSACHDAIRAVGSQLLTRAESGRAIGSQPSTRPETGTNVDDLLTVVNAVAWASEQAPHDAERLDRLLALVTRSLP
jgi:AcrR family transcriptional regulator